MRILLFVFIILALVGGGWSGLNIHNDQALFTNPFAEKSIGENLLDTAKTGFNKSREVLQDKGGRLFNRTRGIAGDAVDSITEKGGKLVKQAGKLASDTVNKSVQVIGEKKEAMMKQVNKTTE